MKKIIFCWCLIITSCNNRTIQHDWKEEDGLVPDSTTAITIAEAIWLNIYGEEIIQKKPYKAHLKDSKIWIVEGTLNSSILSNDRYGGVPYIEIRKDSGTIIKVLHTK